MLIKLLYIFKTLWLLLTHKPLQTIYINFKMLPLKQAIYLPIFIYTKTEFRSLKGEIEIKGRVYPNMIHIGDNTRYVATSRPLSIWTINGKLIFNGHIKFFHGTYITVAKNAVLTFGTDFTMVGGGTKIICFESITIGNHVGITWDCQIYDTSFHYVQNLENENSLPEKLTKPIVINDNVWIGNRSTIAKGSVIPSYSIIASGSMTNKDYTDNGENCMYCGVPAKCKKKSIRRIYDNAEENHLDNVYGYARYKL